MKNIIICGSCGAKLLIAANIPVVDMSYVHINNHGHGNLLEIIYREEKFQIDEPYIFEVIALEKLDNYIENIIQRNLNAILPDKIVLSFLELKYSKKKRKTHFLFYQNLKHYPQKVVGKLGRKINYHIKQPRNRSQYPYRRLSVDV